MGHTKKYLKKKNVQWSQLIYDNQSYLSKMAKKSFLSCNKCQKSTGVVKFIFNVLSLQVCFCGQSTVK